MSRGDGRTLEELGVLVRSARERPMPGAPKGWSIDRAAEAAGLSHMTWRRVEEAQPVRSATYFALERALVWPAGSIRRYLDGGDASEIEAVLTSAQTGPASAPSIYEASTEELRAELARRPDGQPSFEELLEALDRVHRAETGASPVREGVEETPSSVSRRGMQPLRPRSEPPAQDDGSDAGPSGVQDHR